MEQRERKPLLTKEEIDQITEINLLEDYREEVSVQANRIEVDLDFRSDGDDEWERRARGALAAHRITLGHLARRLHRLGRPESTNGSGKGEAKATAAVATAAKHAALAEQAKEATERKRLAVQAQAVAAESKRQADLEREQEKTRRHIASMLRDTAWSRTFVIAANEVLDGSSLLADIRERATAIHDAAVEREIAATAASEFRL